MTKVWFLVVLVYGEVVESPPNPMTAEQCAAEATYWIEKLDSEAVLEKYDGTEVTLNDVEVKCIRRRR